MCNAFYTPKKVHTHRHKLIIIDPLPQFHKNCMYCILYMYMQWSFGVVCWEIFSLGRTPYPGLGNHEVPDYIAEGRKLKKPAICPGEL